jgi:hypothetical protein
MGSVVEPRNFIKDDENVNDGYFGRSTRVLLVTVIHFFSRILSTYFKVSTSSHQCVNKVKSFKTLSGFILINCTINTIRSKITVRVMFPRDNNGHDKRPNDGKRSLFLLHWVFLLHFFSSLMDILLLIFVSCSGKRAMSMLRLDALF